MATTMRRGVKGGLSEEVSAELRGMAEDYCKHVPQYQRCFSAAGLPNCTRGSMGAAWGTIKAGSRRGSGWGKS